MDKKSPDAFRTISEVADWLGVQAHVLRFWESKFPQVKPVKRAGGRRYYRPADMELIGGIKTLLHDQGVTIKDVQKILKEEGVAHVSSFSPSPDEMPADSDELGRNVVKFQGRDADDNGDVAPPVPADDGPLFRSAQDAEETAPQPAADATPEPTAEPGAQQDAVAQQQAPQSAADAPADAAAAPSSEPEEAQEAPGDPTAPVPDDAAPDDASPDAPAPAARIPRRIEAADPPPHDEIVAPPGALSLVAGLSRLDARTTAGIMPLVARLAALRDRMSASDKSD